MSKPKRRARDCGTYQLTTRSSDNDPQGDSRVCDAGNEPPGSDKGNALRTLAAAGAAMSVGAVPKLFDAQARPRSRPATLRLDTVQDCRAALASGVPLTGEEMARVYGVWRRAMLAQGLPLDWYSRRRGDDESLQ